MIGQFKLLTRIKSLPKFPRFCIIEGSRGSGKSTLVREIIKFLGLPEISSSCKLDDIREMIDTAYTQNDAIAYTIYDIDDMSLGAKNSLLKVTEEPPKNAYFIFTIQDSSHTLETIRSRATIFKLDNYSKEELVQYRRYKGYSDKYDDKVKMLCETTGDINDLFKYDIDKFYKLAEDIVKFIHIPTNGNAFKITQFLNIKEQDKGYDCKLLLKMVGLLYLNKAKEENNDKFASAAIVTLKYLNKLNKDILAKQGIIDCWIMDLRKSLR